MNKTSQQTWEEINNDNHCYSARLRVPSGWIVRSYTGCSDGGLHQIFIEDKNHKWEL